MNGPGLELNLMQRIKPRKNISLTCSDKCPMKNYPEFCNGKTGIRLIEKVSECSEKAINLHICIKNELKLNIQQYYYIILQI